MLALPFALLAPALPAQDLPAPAAGPAPFELVERSWPGVAGPVLHGVFEVYENRQLGAGRVLGLDVVVLPALTDDPAPDPIFSLAGGPGQGATGQAGWQARSPLRARRDIVLVDQRGTGGAHRLACDLSGGPDDLQGYLAPIFQLELFRACLAELEARADLTQYTTPIAMDDLDDVRAALGYERINLRGGSYGTRAALVYMRCHPGRVRTAVLNGVAPPAFTNPLYHAREAQDALQRTFEACAADPDCGRAFPDLEREYAAVLERFEEGPVEVELPHPDTGAPIALTLSREAFGEALRVMMYYGPTARQVPLALHSAHQGDFAPFAGLGLRVSRGLRDSLAFGMLLCVTCPEDLARIDPASIPRETAGTFLGDGRVRRQMAVCALWPQGEVGEDYGEPVRCEAPTLVLSGTLDPVTSPRWGAEAARHLPNALHLVLPGSHGVGGPCVEAVVAELLERGSVEGLDLACTESVRLPAFSLPGAPSEAGDSEARDTGAGDTDGGK